MKRESKTLNKGIGCATSTEQTSQYVSPFISRTKTKSDYKKLNLIHIPEAFVSYMMKDPICKKILLTYICCWQKRGCPGGHCHHLWSIHEKQTYNHPSLASAAGARQGSKTTSPGSLPLPTHLYLLFATSLIEDNQQGCVCKGCAAGRERKAGNRVASQRNCLRRDQKTLLRNKKEAHRSRTRINKENLSHLNAAT